MKSIYNNHSRVVNGEQMLTNTDPRVLITQVEDRIDWFFQDLENFISSKKVKN
jgi:hypothetical protein